MKRLIVYAGANGAGKSSLRDSGADPVDLVIDSDRIARELDSVNPRSVDFAAGKQALRLFYLALRQNLSFSLETTLAGQTILTRMHAAKQVGYDVTLRYIAVNDVTINIDRVFARVRQGGHWIDPETIHQRVAGSFENLAAAVVIADRSVLLDNSGPAHKQVLRVEQNRVIYRASTIPTWLAQHLARLETALGNSSGSATAR